MARGATTSSWSRLPPRRVQASRLDRRIQIQQPQTVIDEYGQQTKTWVTVITLWADRRDVTGREMIEAGMDRSTREVRYFIRDPGFAVSPQMRVMEGTQTWNVLAVLPTQERGAGFELMCRSTDNVAAQHAG